MEDAQYVLTCYAIVGVTIGGYAVWLLRRGRTVSRDVPPERRRWSDS
jgi:CcmD family protein